MEKEPFDTASSLKSNGELFGFRSETMNQNQNHSNSNDAKPYL